MQAKTMLGIMAAAVVVAVSWLAVPAAASEDCQLPCVDVQVPVVTATPEPVGQVIKQVEQVVETVEETANKTVETVKNVVDKTSSGVKETVDGVTSSITDTPKKDTTDHLDGDNDKPRNDNRGDDRNRNESPLDRAAGSLRLAAEQASIRPEPAGLAQVAPLDATVPPVTTGPSPLDRLADIAREATKQLAFPLALTLIVAGFLAIQGRLDRRDPKLVLAPVDSEQDFLSFS